MTNHRPPYRASGPAPANHVIFTLHLCLTLEHHLSRETASRFHFLQDNWIQVFHFSVIFKSVRGPGSRHPPLRRLTESGQSTISAGRKKPVIFGPVIISIRGLTVLHKASHIFTDSNQTETFLKDRRHQGNYTLKPKHLSVLLTTVCHCK